MGYWDGVSLIPLDFSLHREKGKNADKPYGLRKKEYRKQYRKKREKESHAWNRTMEADDTKINSALKMFWRAITQGFKVDYVLMDSWFTCELFISAVRKVKRQKVHLIGMYKTPKTRFDYSGEKLTHSQIRNILGKAKRCRKLRLHYKEAMVSYKGHFLKMFFSRQGENGKWKVFITTNTELSFIRMIEIYQIRWTIEVLFKEAKQLLGLGKCQSNDFDAQIAETTITMIQHLLLTLKYRFEHYESKGELFEQVKEGVVQYRLNERLWGLFIELLRIIEVLFEGIDEMEILEKIINDEKAYKILSRLFQDEMKLENAA
jgi:predicted nucleic acid-binding Zn finger protein